MGFHPQRYRRLHPPLPHLLRRRPFHRRLLLQRPRLPRHRLEGLLNSGEDFARRLLADFKPANTNGDAPRARLSHVATDGESYGHHHKHGEMALSYAMHWNRRDRPGPPHQLRRVPRTPPPEYEAEVVEDTSWSCAHGVERWRSNCGCNSGKLDWNQQWRAPLREALDLLRDSVAPLCETLAAALFKDLWVARDAYIQVVPRPLPRLHRSLLQSPRHPRVHPEERITALELLELQAPHPAHVHLLRLVLRRDLRHRDHPDHRLRRPRPPVGAQALRRTRRRHRNRLPRSPRPRQIPTSPRSATAPRYTPATSTPCASASNRSAPTTPSAPSSAPTPKTANSSASPCTATPTSPSPPAAAKVALGRAHIRSRITEETEEICFAVLHFGDQNLSAAIRRYSDANPEDVAAFKAFSADIRTAIRRANLPEVIRLIDRFFRHPRLLPHLALRRRATPHPAHHPRPHPRRDGRLPAQDLRGPRLAPAASSPSPAWPLRPRSPSPPTSPSTPAFGAPSRPTSSTPAEIDTLLARAAADQVTLDTQVLSFAAGQRMKWAMVKLEAATDANRAPETALHTALVIAATLRAMPFEVNLWQARTSGTTLYRPLRPKTT